MSNGRSATRLVVGWVVRSEGALMFLPLITGMVYREESTLIFLIMILVCEGVYQLCKRSSSEEARFESRDGFRCVAISWIIMSMLGAVPFTLSGSIPSYVDALFETISGFTTTGASILSNVEALPYCMLMWRSVTHWIGGMGVLVFIMMLMPRSNASELHLLRAESPGPSVGKMRPRLRDTAIISYVMYTVLTLIEVILLLFGGMSLFEALCMSFGTAGTGGFGVLNSSCATYSPYIQIVLTVFMILFGVNFNVYFLMVSKRFKDAFHSEEVRVYLVIIAIAVITITINIANMFSSVLDALRHSAFQVASIITTTGFATTDFNLWPSFSKAMLVLLMFIGACAGSTGGGIKVSRVIIMWKTLVKQVWTMAHPNAVKKVTLEGKPVEHSVVRATNVFMVSYLLIMAVSVMLITLDGFDLVTDFTAVVATLNNIGPGLEMVGPTGNFGSFSVLSKFVLMFDMLAGRLELFPMLVLISPSAWRNK